MSEYKGIVARLVAMLGAFADGEPALAISQLSERLDIPPSSVHRMLEHLIELEIIERANHRRYRIGPEFFRIGVRVESKFRVVETARPLMQKLSEHVDETCVLSVLIRSKLERLRVAKVDSPRQPLKFRIQMLDRHSLAWGAAGRAILAFMAPDDIERVFSNAPRLSDIGGRLPAFSRLLKDLEEIRLNGYAFAHGELLSSETICIAAPFFGPDRKVVGDLSIIIPSFRFSPGKMSVLAPRLLQTTRQLSAKLGASAQPEKTPPPAVGRQISLSRAGARRKKNSRQPRPQSVSRARRVE